MKSFAVKVKEELHMRAESSSRKKHKRGDTEKELLRSLFIDSGTMNDPKRSYHLELACGKEESAREIAELLVGMGITAKVHRRKEKYCVYIKDADDIASFLGIVGATKSMMEFENERILHDISGNVNRRVNCETANQEKTIKYSMAQIEMIKIIERHGAMNKLPPELYELAVLRMENIDVPLKDLGGMLAKPIGKSGTYHRFERIERFARQLEEEK